MRMRCEKPFRDLSWYWRRKSVSALVAVNVSPDEELETIDPDALTPREALSKLYELKTKLKGG
jgi:hypothetical protein